MNLESLIVTDPRDNVGVVTAPGGLKAGASIGGRLDIRQDVPIRTIGNQARNPNLGGEVLVLFSPGRLT